MSGFIRTEDDLDRISAIGASMLHPDRLKILIGSASCGIAAGAREVEAAVNEAVKELNLTATVSRTGCIGFCRQEPLLDPDGKRLVRFGLRRRQHQRHRFSPVTAKILASHDINPLF